MNKKTLFIIAVFGSVILTLISVSIYFFLIPKEEYIVLPSPEFVLGQNFIVGIPNTTLDEATKEFLTQIKPAGIILYYRNYKFYEQFKDLINQLQEFAQKTTGQPYFIMIDEEPGGATRLNLFKNVFDRGYPEWDRIESDIKEMALLGINIDLAPLADFAFNEDTFIKRRIPAHNPLSLIDFNRKFIELLQENNISATLKHFPGMGVFIDDPHKKVPYISGEEDVVNESIELFKDGIEAGANFVMTGHAIYDDLDPGVPATLSKKIVTDILRDDCDFQGIIITDDISDMPLIVGRGMNLINATAQSLNAGHNLVLFSHNPTMTLGIYNELVQRIEDNIEFKLIVEENYRRIVLAKKSLIQTD